MAKEEITTHQDKPTIEFTESGKKYLMLDNEKEQALDTKKEALENYMKDNEGKNEFEGTDEEKKEKKSYNNKLYEESKQLWEEYASELRKTRYNFHLNRKQLKFVRELLTGKIVYDVNTVFFGIELKNFIERTKGMEKPDNDTDLIKFQANATEITYLYHLMSKHTIKGLNSDSYSFAQVLLRIGEVSKVFNYYDTAAKNLSQEIQDWVAAFDPGVSLEKHKTQEHTEKAQESEVSETEQ